MRKILSFLFLIIALPLSADPPECSVCGREIDSGKIFRYGEQIVCSQKCLKKILPVCAVCGKSIRGAHKRDGEGRHFCSQKCLESILPKCSSCGAPVFRGAKMSNGSCRCEKCLKLPVCDSCKQPIRAVVKPVSDGRQICPVCRRTAIFSPGDAQHEFSIVRQHLRRDFKLYVPGKIHFQLVSRDKMLELADGRKGERGQCRHEVTIVRRGGKVIRRECKRSIFILKGLSLENFRAVAAHELAHDWFNVNVDGRLELSILEGWAELVSWSYCRKMGYQAPQRLIEGNGAVLYREGFRDMQRRLTLPEEPEKIRAFFRDMKKTQSR